MMLTDRKRTIFRLRSMLDQVAAGTGLLQRYERRMRQGLTVLMYHRVLPRKRCLDYPLPSLVIPLEVFQRQIQWLAGRCHVLPVRKAIAELDRHRPSDKPLVAVTFDDGYDDNFVLAAPILEKHGLRGTFFVTSDFVAEGRPQWYDRAALAWQGADERGRKVLLEAINNKMAERPADGSSLQGLPAWMEGLKRAAPSDRLNLVQRAESLAEAPPYLAGFLPMSPEQITELHRQGHEIGSHTVSHPILPQVDDASLAAELRESAEQLKDWTGGAPVIGFCYPNGDYDERVERAVEQAGYEYACTVEEGLNRPDGCSTRLARLPVTMQRTMRGQEHNPLGFRAELCLMRWRMRQILRRTYA